MKKYSFGLLLLCLLLLLPLSFPLPSRAAKELFPGGSFEANPRGYGFAFDFGAEWYLASEGDEGVRSGSRSLLFDCSSGTMQAILCDIPLSGGTFRTGEEYEISLWFKATDGFRGWEYIKLFYAHDGIFAQDDEVPVTTADGQPFAYANNLTGTEGEWEQVTARFTLAPTHGAGGQRNTTGFRISIAFGTVVTPGKFYVDDLSIRRVSEDGGEEDPGDPLTVSVDSASAESNVAFGHPFSLPDVTLRGASSAAKVTFTVYHGDVTNWTPLPGYTDRNNTAADRNLQIDRHGFYRIVYRVTDGKNTAEAEYYLNVMDTLTGIRVAADGHTVEVHPSERLDLPGQSLPGVAVYGTFSYTGERLLSEKEWTVSPAAAPGTEGPFTATVTVRCDYDGTTVTKTAPITLTVVPAGQMIDRTKVTVSVDGTEMNVPYRLPCRLPDVTARAEHGDGTVTDLHDAVIYTIQHNTGTEWVDVAGFVDLPIGTPLGGADGEPLLFTPTEHGYYRVVYRASLDGKEGSAVFHVNIMDTLVGVEIDASRVRTALFLGETPDLDGLSVSRVLSYSGTAPLKEGEYSLDLGAFDPQKEGTYPVTVSVTSEYGGTKTASFLLTVTDRLLSFTVTALPKETVFPFGEMPDLTGIAGKAVFEAGGEREVDPAEITFVGYSPKRPGEQTVSFLYRGTEGGNAVFTVSDTIEALLIDASAAKTEYRAGETPDLNGVMVTRLCASGRTVTVGPDEYTVSPVDFRGCAEGTYLIRVTVTDALTGVTRSAAYPVTVTAADNGWLLPAVIAASAAAIAAIAAVFLLRKKKNTAVSPAETGKKQ